MTADLFDQSTTFTVTVFSLAAVTFIGVCLLILRTVDAAKRRSSRVRLVVGTKQAAARAGNARPVSPMPRPVSTTNVPVCTGPVGNPVARRKPLSVYGVLTDCCNTPTRQISG